MGIDVYQDELTQNTLIWEFVGRWTVDNLVKSMETSRSLLDMAAEPVNFIFDVSKGGLIPPQLMQFIRNQEFNPHPKEGTKVVTGADRYLMVFWHEIAHYLPKHWEIEFADNFEAARAIINTEAQRQYSTVRS